LKLAREYGELSGEEARDLGFDLLESPDINIARVPQGGRVFEGYGEDPFLVSRMAVANIEGIQSTGVIANVKHYVANNQETHRGNINEIISERALREIYMPGFEASVKEAHAASLMCAYPKVNGVFNCENEPLLSQVVKKEWGFDGFVTSDFGAVHSTVASAMGGLDLELPTGIYFDEAMKSAIIQGSVPINKIDEMLERRFAKMMEFGYWGRRPSLKPIPAFEHGAISQQISSESMVLLKNDGGLLPLDRNKIRRLALIGPYAVRAMTGGGGSSHVIPLYSVAPVDGIDHALLQQTPISLLDGNDIPAAITAAEKADVAIVMVGDEEQEGRDHAISLSPKDDDLIAAIAKANPHTVVVLKSGSAVLMPWLKDVPAVLEAWYPGEEDGDAIADVLFGNVNPSGKLPLTFPSSVEDTLARDSRQFPGDGKTVYYSEELEVGYRAFNARNTKPLFPFGFGQSYTTFRYDDLKVIPAPKGDGATILFRLTNTGNRSGEEVAQLYITFPHITEGDEPPKQLRGFSKTFLKPDESKWIRLNLSPRSISYWSVSSHSWQIAHGDFRIMVGGSSAETPLEGTLEMH
jgi:beta-glucosidase